MVVPLAIWNVESILEYDGVRAEVEDLLAKYVRHFPSEPARVNLLERQLASGENFLGDGRRADLRPGAVPDRTIQRIGLG